MNAIQCIKTRRSVRRYSKKPIDKQDLDTIVKMAITAPSGKNIQPWKLKIVLDKEQIKRIAIFSNCKVWLKTAACVIVVFLDTSLSYDYLKDVQSCGAVFQNILLSSHALGIGSCWVGDVLENSDDLRKILHIENHELELMGIVSLGYEDGNECKSQRRNIESFII